MDLEINPVLPESTQRAVNLLMQQYPSSPNLIKYVEILMSPWEALYKVNNDLKTLRSIDSSFGIQLDHIGEVVGQKRIYPGAAPLGYFGFFAEPTTYGPGETADPTVGGALRGTGELESGDLVLSDEDYKRALKARIFRASSNCNINDMYAFLEIIIGQTLDLSIEEDATYPITNITYTGTFSLLNKAVLSQILTGIKPIGTQMNLFDGNGVIPLVGGGGPNNN